MEVRKNDLPSAIGVPALDKGLVRPIRFALVGVANTALDVGIFTLLVQCLATPTALANVIGFGLGTINSYILVTAQVASDTSRQPEFRDQRLRVGAQGGQQVPALFSRC